MGRRYGADQGQRRQRLMVDIPCMRSVRMANGVAPGQYGSCIYHLLHALLFFGGGVLFICLNTLWVKEVSGMALFGLKQTQTRLIINITHGHFKIRNSWPRSQKFLAH